MSVPRVGAIEGRVAHLLENQTADSNDPEIDPRRKMGEWHDRARLYAALPMDARAGRERLLGALKSTPFGLDPTLARCVLLSTCFLILNLALCLVLKRVTSELNIYVLSLSSVPFGLAYHHAGMAVEERDLVEEAYRTGACSFLSLIIRPFLRFLLIPSL
jgi:hypothetical protein